VSVVVEQFELLFVWNPDPLVTCATTEMRDGLEPASLLYEPMAAVWAGHREEHGPKGAGEWHGTLRPFCGSSLSSLSRWRAGDEPSDVR